MKVEKLTEVEHHRRSIQMPFVITVFKKLRESYPTWEALKTYLTSEEAGNFCVRDCESTPFAIIRYKKGETSLASLEDAHWLRSVVWHKEKHLPVCVAPRKATTGSTPISTPLTVEEFYDGVMVNLFKCNGDSETHITTRSQMNASGKFYSEKTFKEMFTEATSIGNVLQIVPSEEFPAVFVSTVLQHPENRVVANIVKPTVHEIEVGRVHADGTVTISPCVNSSPITFTDDKESHELLRKEAIKRGWRWQGFVYRDTSGNRWRMRSTTYSYLRTLRGNDAKAVDRFLRLRAAGSVIDYLKHYSEERTKFWEFETTLRTRTRQIYDGYVSVHKTHEKKLADLPQPDKTVVFKLHAHYLAHLREQKKSVRLQDVIDLVNALPLWEQALLLAV
jgi:hypothetical protein